MSFKFKKGVRAKLEAHLLKRMKQVDTSDYNFKIWRDILPKLSDGDLNTIIDGEGPPLYTELGGTFTDSIEHIVGVLKEMGVEVYQHIYLTNPKTGITSKSINPHMLCRVPVRTQTQSFEKKSSIPIHNRLIDATTNQVTGSGVSRASSISSPESYLIYSEGYVKAGEEFVNVRGGNQELQRAVHSEILATGKGRSSQPHLIGTQSKAPKVLGRIYKAMHIGTNLDRE